MCNTKKIYSFPPHIIYNKKKLHKKIREGNGSFIFCIMIALDILFLWNIKLFQKKKMFQKKKTLKKVIWHKKMHTEFASKSFKNIEEW